MQLELGAAEIKLRAVRRIGQLSEELDTAENQYALSTNGKSKTSTLKSAGISTSAAQRYEKVAAIPEREMEEYIAGKLRCLSGRCARSPI
jgi:hypothetical protein